MKQNKNTLQENITTPNVKENIDEKVEINTNSNDLKIEDKTTNNSINNLININEVISKISYAPFFIASFSRPVFQPNISLRFISAITMHVNPLVNRYSHIPIIFSGFRKHFNLNCIKIICIVTNNPHFATWFLRNFNKGSVSVDVKIFSSIDHLMKNKEYIENKNSQNTIFLFYLLPWSEIASSFAKHGYSITGGKTGKRHILSPLTFRFVQSLMELGFPYDQVKENYTNSTKENIQVLNNNQIIASNLCKSLLESSNVNLASDEELDNYNNKESN